MSEILRLYQNTAKLRPAQARVIPGQAVNFVDRNNEYSENFKTFQELKRTAYTDAALNFFDKLYSELTPPQNWVPIEQGINLHRWTAGNKYYNPGQPGS